MRGSSKFEVRPPSSNALWRSRSSKQIRRAEIPVTPIRSVNAVSLVNVGLANDPFPLTPARAPSWRKPDETFGADVRLLMSAATRLVDCFEIRVSKLFRISDFEFRVFFPCK